MVTHIDKKIATISFLDPTLNYLTDRIFFFESKLNNNYTAIGIASEE